MEQLSSPQHDSRDALLEASARSLVATPKRCSPTPSTATAPGSSPTPKTISLRATSKPSVLSPPAAPRKNRCSTSPAHRSSSASPSASPPTSLSHAPKLNTSSKLSSTGPAPSPTRISESSMSAPAPVPSPSRSPRPSSTPTHRHRRLPGRPRRRLRQCRPPRSHTRIRFLQGDLLTPLLTPTPPGTRSSPPTHSPPSSSAPTPSTPPSPPRRHPSTPPLDIIASNPPYVALKPPPSPPRSATTSLRRPLRRSRRPRNYRRLISRPSTSSAPAASSPSKSAMVSATPSPNFLHGKPSASSTTTPPFLASSSPSAPDPPSCRARRALARHTLSLTCLLRGTNLSPQDPSIFSFRHERAPVALPETGLHIAPHAEG